MWVAGIILAYFIGMILTAGIWARIRLQYTYIHYGQEYKYNLDEAVGGREGPFFLVWIWWPITVPGFAIFAITAIVISVIATYERKPKETKKKEVEILCAKCEMPTQRQNRF